MRPLWSRFEARLSGTVFSTGHRSNMTAMPPRTPRFHPPGNMPGETACGETPFAIKLLRILSRWSLFVMVSLIPFPFRSLPTRTILQIEAPSLRLSLAPFGNYFKRTGLRTPRSPKIWFLSGAIEPSQGSGTWPSRGDWGTRAAAVRRHDGVYRSGPAH